MGMRKWVLCILSFVTVMPFSWSQATQKATDDRADAQNSQANAGTYHFRIEPERTFSETPGVYCAYLRTYRVKREYPGSDVVRPAGYSECVPTQRFEVKRALHTQDEASPDK
jgi:hypothetical protein